MRLLLDTNAYTALVKGQDDVVAKVRQCETLYFSAIVMGELMFGFRSGNRFEQNLATLNTFLSNPYVRFLPVTQLTADRFGRVATGLKRKGTPIPTNDLWIAAHVFEAGADLVTFDKHFENVDGLPLADL